MGPYLVTPAARYIIIINSKLSLPVQEISQSSDSLLLL
jgi:hypothetical protein